MNLPFFPVTKKLPGDTILLPKHPASFFCGQANDVFVGIVQPNGRVEWKGDTPDHITSIYSDDVCLLK